MFYRLELKDNNNKHINHGIGNKFGWSYLKGLDGTPSHIKSQYQHWFTEKGFEKFGKKIIEKEINKYNLKVRKVKKLPTKIMFKDEYQVAIKFK